LVEVAAQVGDAGQDRGGGFGGGEGRRLQALEGVEQVGGAGEGGGVVEAGGFVGLFVGAEEVAEHSFADHAAGGALGAGRVDRGEREAPGGDAHAGDVGLVEQVAAPERALQAVERFAERGGAGSGPAFAGGAQRGERVAADQRNGRWL
jgi:hypothetical protein